MLRERGDKCEMSGGISRLSGTLTELGLEVEERELRRERVLSSDGNISSKGRA